MATERSNTPWNNGKLVGQKPPLRPRDVWAIRIRLQITPRPRDLALFNLAIDSKLRGCDLVALRVDDVALGGRIRGRALVLQRKTNRAVQFELTDQTREALESWIKVGQLRAAGPLFPSRKSASRPIIVRHYARLVDAWFASAGFNPAGYGTHSLRRTKAALIYRRTGNLRAEIESTVRYLGVEVEDALAISEQVEI
jgi:integrase